MGAVSLFGVLLVAKAIFVLAGPEPAPLTALGFLWQDVLLALLFALFAGAADRATRGPVLSWVAYGVLALYTAINLAVVQTLSAPLTWHMAAATDLTLADSILHHVTPAALTGPAVVLLAALGLPFLLAKFRRGFGHALVGAAVLFVLAGPILTGRVTAGPHCNGVVALLASAVPRVSARAADGPRDWRRVQEVDRTAFAGPLAGLCGTARGRNVVLVVLESVGARYLAPYGANEDPMPNLSALARAALTFDHAYAVCPESIKGLAALQYSVHPALDTAAKQYRRPPVAALGSVVAAAGYRTALFHSGRFEYLGMADIIAGGGYQERVDAADISGNRESSFGVDEEATVARMLEWVDRIDDQPFFLTYMPVAGHHPYDSPESGPFASHTVEGAYKNAIHYADRAIGQLISGLERRRLFADTVFVVVGDHGQAFGQHPGNFGHTFFLYEENVHVPLFVSVPGHTLGEQHVATLASHVDVAPTVLDLLGLRPPAAYEGASLLSSRRAMALMFTDYALAFLGLRDGRFKFILQVEADRSLLFDLHDDPEETKDLSAIHPRRVADYRRHLLEWSAAQRAAVAGW